MAVQQSKTSKQRTNTRFSNNSKLSAPALVECPQCHELKAAHRACTKCGYYKGVQVINVEKKAKED